MLKEVAIKDITRSMRYKNLPDAARPYVTTFDSRMTPPSTPRAKGWPMSSMGGKHGIFVLFFASDTVAQYESIAEANLFSDGNNCSTTDSFVIFRTPSETQRDEREIVADVLIDGPRNDTNISHLKTPMDWNNWTPKLKFPTTSSEKEYKMANLHLDRGMFVFDFLRKFLSLIQPYDVPVDLLTDAIENRVDTSRLISESIHLEATLLVVFGMCCILCCVIPGIELWLACRPIREDYKPSQHPSVLTFSLAFFVCILGLGMITMIVCNETISASVEKFPIVVETALQDLNDYHSSTTIQLRKCLSRSLDVASEAILADLDNIEELLGKPVQTELSAETGLDNTLNMLIDLVNASHRVSSNVESLLSNGENIRSLGKQLSREMDDLRRNLESALRACTGQDRPLCTIIDSSGLRLTLRIDQFLRDNRLQYLRDFKRENFTETIRQARGEYMYIPQHIARNSLEIRNLNKMRARIFDEARNMEASNSELVKQLEFARHLVDYTTPYIIVFEHVRWLVAVGATAQCRSMPFLLELYPTPPHESRDPNQPIANFRCISVAPHEEARFFGGVFTACIISVILWAVFLVTLILSSHTEMLICRPLHDSNYSTMQAILETRIFLGKKLSIPLKDLFEKCRENEPAYPAFGLGNTMKLEQLTAYWTWSGFTRIILKIKVQLKTLRIFTPYLEQQLHNLLYACGLNLTEHRIAIQERILNKDLEALSDQLDKVTEQMSDRLTARSLETIVINMQDLNQRRVKPLMRFQDELLYKLAALELQVKPLQQQINDSLTNLKTIQYYIDSQSDKIAQLKTKLYTDRLANYLDQWRFHVLSEMGNGVAKCRPLWDVMEGIKLLLCSHFLGNLSGFWFATFLCIVIMIASTPTAHVLSLVYKKFPSVVKNANLVTTRTEDPPTETNEQENWNTPE
ncbi:Prominin-1-A [Melipona quadrifasciata]|uniref:Prominin-1-A n=1 Tax=Melipona quadrifasciata TaxID=166423 RepID=A0A0M9AB43_9HYME|nr:Prominin-1-A [Melipona quadrifasciata]